MTKILSTVAMSAWIATAVWADYPCPGPGPGETNGGKADITFNGQAVAVWLTNIHQLSVDTILIGDTGQLSPTGGQQVVTINDTNVVDALTIGETVSATASIDNCAVTEVAITNFYLQFVTTNGTQHTLSFTSLVAQAFACCTNGGASLTGALAIADLTLDGTAVSITGETNQVITFNGGQLVINAQATVYTQAGGQLTLSGLTLSLDGCMAGHIGLVSAGVDCREGPPPPEEECDRVTAGGWIAVRGKAKATFAFQGGIRKGIPAGNLTYIDHSRKMKVKSTTCTGYSIVGENTRRITYNVWVNGVPGTAVLVVTDNGEPGRADRFSITLSNGYSAAATLGGGNIQLHKCIKAFEKEKKKTSTQSVAKPVKAKKAKAKKK